MKLLINLFVLFVFYNFGLATSLDSTTLTLKILTKEQMVEDYGILYSTLKNYHPAPFLYTPESEFERFYQEQVDDFPDSMNELEFHVVARKLIALLRCGHTLGKPSDAWYSSLKGQKVLLPFEIRSRENQVFISNTVDGEFDFEIGDEILNINGRSIQDVLQEMASIQERDGTTNAFVNEAIVRKFRTYFLFLNGYQDDISLSFKTKAGEIKNTNVKLSNKRMKETPKVLRPENLGVVFENNWSVFAMDTLNNLGYLNINSFSDRKEYKKYYKQVFQYLETNPDARLVLDLRDNGGGYFGNGNELLTYLTPHKFEFNFQRPEKILEENEYTKMEKWNKLTKLAFNLKPSKYKKEGMRTHTFKYKPDKRRFKGQVNVITNGITFSQSALVAAQLHQQGAIFYGSETGGNESSTNAMAHYVLNLPNSNVKVLIAHYQVTSNSTLGEFGRGIKPDYEICPGLESSEDIVLKAAMAKIISLD